MVGRGGSGRDGQGGVGCVGVECVGSGSRKKNGRGIGSSAIVHQDNDKNYIRNFYILNIN